MPKRRKEIPSDQAIIRSIYILFLELILNSNVFILKLSSLRNDLDNKNLINKIKDLKLLPKLVQETLLTENKIAF